MINIEEVMMMKCVTKNVGAEGEPLNSSGSWRLILTHWRTQHTSGLWEPPL